MNDTAKMAPETAAAEVSKKLARVPQGMSIVDQMLSIAMRTDGVDVDKLERLYALKQKYDEDEARKDFVDAMSQFRAEPIAITKNKHVSFTTRDGDTTAYDHAELADVTEVVGPIMAKHRLSFRWNPRKEGDRVVVDTIVQHANGHSETVTLDGPLDASGKKNAIQQLGSTITYLQRYGLMAVLGVAARGQDNDGKLGKVDDEPELNPEQIAENERIETLYDKIKLSETIEELRKLKPEISPIKDATHRRNLTGAWNVRAKEFKLAEAA